MNFAKISISLALFATAVYAAAVQGTSSGTTTALPKGSPENAESLWKAAVTGKLYYLRFLVEIRGINPNIKTH